MKQLIIICLLVSSQLLSAQDILIKNATLITITEGVKENTDLLIKDGKISKIGKGLQAKPGTTEIDGTDKYVMPGIVDAHSHLALDVVNEASAPMTAQVWVGDVLNPMDVGIYRALAGGVTISHAMHGSANAIGGQCETIKHRWGVENPEALKMENAPRTIKFALGENPMRVHGEGRSLTPRTRMGMEQIFRKAFAEAQVYRDDWKDYKSGKTKTPPLYNLNMETMVDILEGEILIHCHSYRADEILMLMRVLKDYGVSNITFQHVNEGFKVAPELAEWGAHASVFSDWWAYKFEVYYSTAYNAAILTKNGVVTSINSDSRELIRHLYHEAAKTQKYGGLTDNEALRLITINPAIQLGIDKRVGSLEVGKDGDVVMFSKHPLSIYAIPELTIVDGIVRFDRSADPPDVRIDIDPKNLPSFIESNIGSHNCDQDGCMQGVSTHTHKH